MCIQLNVCLHFESSFHQGYRLSEEIRFVLITTNANLENNRRNRHTVMPATKSEMTGGMPPLSLVAHQGVAHFGYFRLYKPKYGESGWRWVHQE